jgi:hypothetical protein
VLLGNGDGTFQTAVNFATNYPVRSLAVGDFNLDGRPDLALGYGTTTATIVGGEMSTGGIFLYDFEAQYDEGVTFLEGQGDGTFAYGADVSIVNGTYQYQSENPDDYPEVDGSIVTYLAAGDFDGNGTLDVVAATSVGEVADLINDTPTPTPAMAINNISVTEGNNGTTNAVFTVNLSAPSASLVTVQYATANGTATAGSDYQASSGMLTFAPGETSKTISVLVNGDRLPEQNETFSVNLSSPTNASLAHGHGTGTIVDDEPRISISDVTKFEGRKGQTTLFTFTVTLSTAYDQAVTMSFKTTDGSAKTGDNDYVAKTGTITFNPGETTKTITISVIGDNKREADESFYLDLFGNSSNSLFTRSRGIGTILNDD